MSLPYDPVAAIPAGDYIMSTAHYNHDDIAPVAGDGTVRQLQEAQASMHKGLVAVQEALKVRNPTKTPEAHLSEVKKKADAFLQTVARKSGAASENGKNALAAIEMEMKQRFLVSSAHASEIRSYLRGLNQSERFSMLEEAAKAGDAATLAAIMDAPAYLSGTTKKQQEAVRDLFLSHHAKDLLARKKGIEKALEINFHSFNEAIVAVHDYFKPETMKKIAEGERRAQEAINAIEVLDARDAGSVLA